MKQYSPDYVVIQKGMIEPELMTSEFFQTGYELIEEVPDSTFDPESGNLHIYRRVISR